MLLRVSSNNKNEVKQERRSDSKKTSKVKTDTDLIQPKKNFKMAKNANQQYQKED